MKFIHDKIIANHSRVPRFFAMRWLAHCRPLAIQPDATLRLDMISMRLQVIWWAQLLLCRMFKVSWIYPMYTVYVCICDLSIQVLGMRCVGIVYYFGFLRKGTCWQKALVLLQKMKIRGPEPDLVAFLAFGHSWSFFFLEASSGFVSQCITVRWSRDLKP